jgi:putative transposase
VPYANLGQPPISLWELEEARKQLRKDGRRTLAEKSIFASILQQRQIVNEAVTSSRQRRRQEKTPAESRVHQQTEASPKDANDVSAEIKPYPVEIWGPD